MPDLDALAIQLPDGALLVDPDRMDGYRWDRANDPDAGVPLAVVRATCTEDVQAAVRFAAAAPLAVVPRGAGSGLSGGASAQDGCLVISTERMRAIDVDPATRIAVVEPVHSTPRSRRRPPSTASGTRRTPRRTRSARSAATSPPTPVACAASSTA